MLFKDFNKFNFNVIDITNNTQPEMTVNINGISFNSACLNVLNNPDYVHLMLDTENKVFAIQSCKKNDSNSLNFTKKDYKSGINSNCKAIRICIRNTMADTWSKDKRYKMSGVVFAANNAIVFDLNSATEYPALPTTGIKRVKPEENE